MVVHHFVDGVKSTRTGVSDVSPWILPGVMSVAILEADCVPMRDAIGPTALAPSAPPDEPKKMQSTKPVETPSASVTPKVRCVEPFSIRLPYGDGHR
jgi:hypothetical protein